jgi:uridine kinase
MRESTFNFRFGVIEIGSIESTTLSLLFTINFVIGLTISVKLLNDSIKLDDFYGIGRKPLSIAVAGDSGVGKDMLVSSISRAFGDSEVAVLHGDDYHLHERGDFTWRTTTHLDPEANDLGAWSRDFRKAIKREKVFSRHYDHSVGRFTPPYETPARDLVILNGLHSHLIPNSEKIDLKVFLSMDENLRVVLKVKRDTIERGSGDPDQVIKFINDRKDHFNSFVLPQKLGAHLILHLFPITEEPLRLGVSIRTPNQSVVREIYRIVNSLGRVASRLDRSDSGELWLTVEAYEISKDENLDILLNSVTHPDKILVDSNYIDSGINGFIAAVCLFALAKQRTD